MPANGRRDLIRRLKVNQLRILSQQQYVGLEVALITGSRLVRTISRSETKVTFYYCSNNSYSFGALKNRNVYG